MKEHLEREMINELRDCALSYYNHQSLRERLSHIVKHYIELNKQWQS
jgi:hypothetical protein